MEHYSLTQPDNIVYWFYYGDEPIDSAICPRQFSFEQIMGHAIEQHRLVPLHFPPYEHEGFLRQSRIYIFDPNKKEISS